MYSWKICSRIDGEESIGNTRKDIHILQHETTLFRPEPMYPVARSIISFPTNLVTVVIHTPSNTTPSKSHFQDQHIQTLEDYNKIDFINNSDRYSVSV